ncbi:hypothetical protein E3N88_22347 [Mikania micrantha]|uniref:Uncharacterized protein n=1 Tax=Mikania micrantha TaxID=192012 RepID=A0A5N6NA44_9ASTR|nr:hypothetical protein E3N88_22347 [Mikania micrantha]
MVVCGVSHRLRRRTTDRGNNREEYPEGCSGIYPSSPCFDEYGDEEVKKNDYLWVLKALNVVAIQEGGPLKGTAFLLGSNRGLSERIIGLNDKYLNRWMTGYTNTLANNFDELLEVDPMMEGDLMVVGLLADV